MLCKYTAFLKAIGLFGLYFDSLSKEDANKILLKVLALTGKECDACHKELKFYFEITLSYKTSILLFFQQSDLLHRMTV